MAGLIQKAVDGWQSGNGGPISDSVKGMIGAINAPDTSTLTQGQQANPTSANLGQQAIVGSPQVNTAGTEFSGASNGLANSANFGDRTNGLGVMTGGMRFNNGQQGLAASGMNQPGTIGGVPNGTNGYNIMNGVQLV